MEKISRNQENFIIMTVIYDEIADQVAGKGANFRDVDEIIREMTDNPLPFKEHSAYVQNMISSVLNNYGSIITAFQPHLRNWKWERLPLLTQAILLMSYSHFYFIEKVDKVVVINTAVELAKKYIDDKQAKFVNAILDSGVLK